MFENDWEEVLRGEFEKPYFADLQRKLEEEYANGAVFPAREDIYRALRDTSYEGTKVVILGQDPYHGAGQAHGLSFSVKRGVKLPPSLKNIYRELHDDLGCTIPAHGNLEAWAEQGVLLLNSVLTVRESEPNSHRKLGWEKFTDSVIESLGRREKPLVFVLWGRHAQEKRTMIDERRHLVIATAHPSPLSARNGFFGSKPFSRSNGFLRSTGQTEIDWCIPE